MTHTQSAARAASLRCLALVLASAAIAWLLFIIGQYVRLMETAGAPEGSDPTTAISSAPYFNVAAVVVLSLGALLAKRRLAAYRALEADRSTLVAAVAGFAMIMVIVSAVLATWAVFALFLGGFFDGRSADDPAARIIDLYVPIVLYTALVVTLLLMGFVFPGRAAAPAEAAPSAAAPALPATAPAPADPRAGQRAVALAFATPIIAAAIALVLGLIVYDVTRTALEVWVWLVILVLIAVGVALGTAFARRGQDALGSQAPVAGAASVLNFVLVVVFAVAASSMSLGYGIAAVSGLSISPNLSLSAYADEQKFDETGVMPTEFVDPHISLWGSDLKRGSTATVDLEPGDAQPILTATVDGARWLSEETILRGEDLAPGAYVLTATGEAPDGQAITSTLRLTVTEGSTVVFPDGEASTDMPSVSRILPISAGWFFGDLLPAGLLLLLALCLLATTLRERNRARGGDTAAAPAAAPSPAAVDPARAPSGTE
ncbi:MAG: hypothetical protein KDB25_02880 [Leucobacter sp.]|nr:hypothetical protein [Leucobacter sp.]